MSGGSKKAVVGYRYYLGMHLGVCAGPVDAVLELRAGDRTAWTGNVTSSTSIAINVPGLFGGEEREGGIAGTVDVMMGEPAQGANGYLAGVQGGPQPAYRGILGLVFRQCLMSANNPYIKPIAIRARRILKGWQSDAPWYSAKAAITLPGGVGQAMNPAHIVYECLTNADWGMGYGSSLIDDANFRAAADTFFAEGFGLCIQWTRQQQIEAFIQQVVDHAGAVLGQDRATGKFILKPLRGGYTVGTLPLFDETNVIALDSYERPAIPDAVNEIAATFTDVSTGADSTVRVQNLANITAQGGVVTQTKPYPGLPTADLALRVALRDLRAVSTPLAKVRMRVNRFGYALLPGDVIRLSWAKLGLTSLVLRVLRVNTGTVSDGEITIEAAEDVFGLAASTYAEQPPIEWEDPTGPPSAATQRVVREATFYELQRQFGSADAQALPADAGYVVAAASRGTGLTYDFGLRTRVGAAAYTEADRGPFAPSGALTATLTPGATTATLTSLVDADLVTAGGYAQVDAEIVRVDSFNPDTGALTLGRGVMGTVAASHSAGARVYFLDGYLAADETERVAGEVVNVKLTPRTGRGELAEASAPTDSITITGVPARPYPPGRVRVGGVAYPDPDVAAGVNPTITWSHRNRLQQNLEGDESGNIGPEAGTTYSIEIRNGDTNALLASSSGITGTSYAPTLSGDIKVRVILWAVRAGLQSAQRHDFFFTGSFRSDNETSHALYNILPFGANFVGIRESETSSQNKNTVALMDAATNQLISFLVGAPQQPGPLRISQIAVSGSNVYVGTFGVAPNTVNALYRVTANPFDYSSIDVGGGGVAVGGGYVWHGATAIGALYKLNPSDLSTVSVYAGIGNLGFLHWNEASGRLFGVRYDAAEVLQINPADGSVERTFSTVAGPLEALVASGKLYVRGSVELGIYEVSTGALVRVAGSVAPSNARQHLTLSNGFVVYAEQGTSDLVYLIPATGGEAIRTNVPDLVGPSGSLGGTLFLTKRKLVPLSPGIYQLITSAVDGEPGTAATATGKTLTAAASLIPGSANNGSVTAPGAVITAAAAIAAGMPTGADPFISDVLLLLHADDAQGSSAFLDAGPLAKGLTAIGNARHSTAQAKFGPSSMTMSGLTSSLRVGSTLVTPPEWAAIAPAGGGSVLAGLTVEGWAYIEPGATDTVVTTILSLESDVTGFAEGIGSLWNGFALRIRVDGTAFRLLASNGNIFDYSDYWNQLIPSVRPARGEWFHFAFVFDAGKARFFINGVSMLYVLNLSDGQYYDWVNFAPYIPDASTLLVGAARGGLLSNTGGVYVDGLRASKRARYTGAYTPVTGIPQESWPAKFTPLNAPFPSAPSYVPWKLLTASTTFIPNTSLNATAAGRVLSVNAIYIPPFGSTLSLQQGSGAYTPPAGGAVDLQFSADGYSPPIVV